VWRKLYTVFSLMHTRRFNLSLLESPLFVVSLAMLGINDLLLKPIEINWFTGKLSDFAGLTSLLLFLIAVFPHRAKAIAWSLAAAWIFWKLPISRGALSFANETLGLGWARVEDLTDLITLSILPFVYQYAPSYKDAHRQFELRHGLLMLTALSLFTGTSRTDRYSKAEYRIDYYYDIGAVELREKIRRAARTLDVDASDPGKLGVTVSAAPRDSMTSETAVADFTLGQSDRRSRLRLHRIISPSLIESDLLPYVETHLINKLPAYTSREERLFFTGKHGAPAWPIILLLLSLWPLSTGLRRRAQLQEAWRNQEKKHVAEVYNALQFLTALFLIAQAIWLFIDAYYVGGPYIP
jgi:hypothetical protein